ncbi:DGQHR domain-containing protein [Tenacibaculum adriaticum]|uniref:DGQHR domain-containing protein n=1 Tax=Tenacibaculum adriaticum TaxID=413713 RepID=A0A5S5DSS3_9FLAO|nr:DGQHR domain-containing protein [Tenacibaculum adriaticum]TYP98941.1 DGQHR domain-containing protein [Tenacibaculum adriaticum]
MEVINRPPIEFKCLEAEQPIGTVYIGVMNHDDLEYISYADVRRLELGIDNREVEDYIGIQRQLNTKREKDIGAYVNLVDASFPNSIILSISSEDVEYDNDSKTMSIKYKDDVAKVLDGQHRIAGLRHFEKPGDQFQVIVSIYIDMDIEDQAIVFATINKEQKNVSNSLVQDLFAFAKSRSPQKTAHNIARALSQKEGSPFYRKIKVLGSANRKESETITQDTFAKNLIKYISSNPQSDRDFYKRNKENSSKKPDLIDGKELQKLFLRNIFINDEKDIKIAQILYNYFYVVDQKWPNAWRLLQPNIILNRSTGFVALMRFFKDAYLSFDKIGDVITKEEFKTIFDRIELKEEDFNKERYVPGSSGIGELYRDFLNQSGLG